MRKSETVVDVICQSILVKACGRNLMGVFEMSVLILVAFLANTANGFNVEEMRTIVRHSGRTNTAFGVSVAMLQSGTSGWRLLVGAPKSVSNSNATGGTVYSCNVLGSSTICDDFYEKFYAGPLNVLGGALYIRESNQLFGQTLLASKGRVVACAPRLKLDNEVTSDNRTIRSYYPGGVCVLYNENIEEGTDFIPVSPLGTGALRQFNKENFVVAEMGFSAAIENGENLLIGCPLCYKDMGNAFVETVHNIIRDPQNANNNPVVYREVDVDGGVIGDYLGFSVAIGSFFSDEVTYAMAKPKAFNFKGGVTVFKRVEVSGFRLMPLTTVQGSELNQIYSVMESNEDQQYIQSAS